MAALLVHALSLPARGYKLIYTSSSVHANPLVVAVHLCSSPFHCAVPGARTMAGAHRHQASVGLSQSQPCRIHLFSDTHDPRNTRKACLTGPSSYPFRPRQWRADSAWLSRMAGPCRISSPATTLNTNRARPTTCYTLQVHGMPPSWPTRRSKTTPLHKRP